MNVRVQQATNLQTPPSVVILTRVSLRELVSLSVNFTDFTDLTSTPTQPLDIRRIVSLRVIRVTRESIAHPSLPPLLEFAPHKLSSFIGSLARLRPQEWSRIARESSAISSSCLSAP